jgi:cell division protein FtsL
MNTAVRALQHPHHAGALPKPSFALTAHKPGVGTLLLVIFVLLSGLAVIYLADINRRMAISLEENMTMQNQLHQQWGNLLLEQSTWSTQARIQSIAAQQLNMQTPASNQVVIVKIST